MVYIRCKVPFFRKERLIHSYIIEALILLHLASGLLSPDPPHIRYLGTHSTRLSSAYCYYYSSSTAVLPPLLSPLHAWPMYPLLSTIQAKINSRFLSSGLTRQFLSHQRGGLGLHRILDGWFLPRRLCGCWLQADDKANQSCSSLELLKGQINHGKHSPYFTCSEPSLSRTQ